MFIIKPDFYDDFKCIAGGCKDSCCIGWEIDINTDALEKYNNMHTALGEEIRSKITRSEDGSYCFELCENDRCPFLDEKNLCRIIKARGEDDLCDICKEHPRFYNEFVGVTECGLGLCCEEACRLLLEKDNIFSLVEERDGEKILLETKEDVLESDTYIYVSAVRDEYFKILAKNDLGLEEKEAAILEYTEKAFGVKCTLRNDRNNINYYLKTEPINSQWTFLINDLFENSEKYLKIEEEFDRTEENDNSYSLILAYIIYRHFINSVFDKEFARRIAFCIEAVRFIKLCDIKTFYEKSKLELSDRIENLKNWSKQIEYSEENTDLLIYGE